MVRSFKKSPIPICESSSDLEASTSFCIPASVNDFQLCTMKSCNLCAYQKIDDKILQINNIKSTVAYLYISPTDTKKLNRKDKVRLAADGVRNLHIYKQYSGQLRCEYVGTKSIQETTIKFESPWIWWIVFWIIVIIFGYLTYYWRTNQCFKSPDYKSKDPIAW